MSGWAWFYLATSWAAIGLAAWCLYLCRQWRDLFDDTQALLDDQAELIDDQAELIETLLATWEPRP